MKYLVLLCDGMGDLPIDALGGKTPLEAACTPNMDYLAKNSEVGLCDTINGCPPSSDIANMSILSYDPKVYHTGRSPLEAMAMGLDMARTDMSFRCNLVTLSDAPAYKDKTMLDYCAGEISSAEAAVLIAALNAELGNDNLAFYPGVSYRHCLIMHRHEHTYSFTPPHDITGRPIAGYLPDHDDVLQLMVKSYDILKDHPVNLKRRAKGLHEANAIWLWGEGTKPRLDAFNKKYGLKATMITAVDLLKGIAVCAGMDTPRVEGATGNIDTNYVGKGNAAIEAFRNGSDLVYIHIEAPDECAHRGELQNKIDAISTIDNAVLGPVSAYLNQNPPYCLMVLPDHYTPLATRTHSSEFVPYLIYRSESPVDSGLAAFNEKNAALTGNFVKQGYKLMDRFIKGDTYD